MSIEAAQAAKDYGADLIGFVFADSRRRIAVQEAEYIARQVGGIGKVGVFVNRPLREVQEIARYCQLDFVQLHGEETPQYCQVLGYPIIKAFRVAGEFDITQAAAYNADWILLDSFIPDQYGGTGITLDWQLLKNLHCQVKRPLMMAGGLTPGNVGEAIKIMNPAGVDVSGGVETNGVKDLEKIRDFIIAARAAKGGEGNA